MLDQESVTKSLKLKAFLPYRLSVLSNKISRSISDKYEKKFNLSLAEWRTIAILGETEELSAAEVAERTAMDKVAISRAVNNLLKHNRLKRHFAVSDKRRSVLALSEIGRNIYNEITPLVLTYEQSLLDGLSKEEQVFLDSILKKLSLLQDKSEL